MKLCIVSHLYPVNAEDYKGIFVHQIAAALVRRGHAVHVVTPLRPGAARLERRDGVVIHRHWWWGWWRGRQLGQLQGTPPLMLGSLLLIGTLATVTAILRYRLDLVYAYWVVPGGFIARLAGLLTRRPMVATAAGSDLHTAPMQRPLVRPFLRFTLRGADRIIAAGSDLERLALTFGLDPARAVVLASMVQDPPPPPDAPPPEPLPGTPGQRLLYVGNFDPPKRVDTLLRAMALTLPVQPAARLILIGDGPLRPELEALAQTLGIRAAVDFFGRRPPESILGLMRQADLFVHCSDNEGMPVAIHEALTAGLPVIAARVGGIPDLVIPGETGILFPPDDAAGFAQAITALLADPAARQAMSDRAAGYARTHLRADTIIVRLEAILQTLIASPRKNTK